MTRIANHPLGTATRMGPGYYPVLLGIVAIGLSLVIFLSGMSGGDRLPRSHGGHRALCWARLSPSSSPSASWA
ncbi:hypothetical protein [Chelativorans salis]|uniref:Uncharacterized protein n=1 Tax=Chelativorans salis TaxID=2978478 RepID=A0ABT2LI09_9HYPH|nr:hypothetical protein [Chelativorans sp. EGI FJ00035]MCT7374212.1 hypothetical protein [Chelativorans sp. EGI FJ00035]